MSKLGSRRVHKPIRVEGDVAYVSLTKGYEAVIDAADVETVRPRSWHAYVDYNTVYAIAHIRKEDGEDTTVYLHRFLLSAPRGVEVDHISRNGLDNRRSNLRIATRAQNMRNRGPNLHTSSGLKGASWDSGSGKWKARIQADGRLVHLGMFSTAELAHEAYAKASVLLHGDFRRLK